MSKTTEKKIPKRDYYNALFTHFQETGRSCDGISAEQMMDFILHEIDLLNRKNSTERKPTERQTENAVLADAILSTLTAEPDRLFTISELIKEVPGMPEDMTPQRMSAILRNTAGVVKSYEKRKAYFSAE